MSARRGPWVAASMIGAVIFLTASTKAAAADESKVVERETDSAKKKPPSQVLVSTSAMMTMGKLGTLSTTRFGVGLEVRARFFSAETLLEFGRTPNGLGTHRLEVGANVTTPIGWFRASIGPHVGYAMVVRTTERNAFGRALFGDIGSFSVGAHARLEVSIPISSDTRIFAAVRGMIEAYDGAFGWELGPTAGVHF